MFNNLGLHFELISPLSVILLVIGGILGYGSKFILKLLHRDKEFSEMTVIALKTIGLVLVIAGVLIIFI